MPEADEQRGQSASELREHSAMASDSSTERLIGGATDKAVGAPAAEAARSEPESAEQKERRWEDEHPQGMVTSGHDQIVLWNFGVADADLKPEHISTLNAFVAEHAAELAEKATLRVYGGASSSGFDQTNRDLAEKRAGSVAAAVTSGAAGGVRIQSGSQHEDFRNGSSGEDFAKARRVVVTITRPELSPERAVEQQSDATTGPAADSSPIPVAPTGQPVDSQAPGTPRVRVQVEFKGIKIPFPCGVITVDVESNPLQVGESIARVTAFPGPPGVKVDVEKVVPTVFGNFRFALGTRRGSIGVAFGDGASMDVELNFEPSHGGFFSVSGQTGPLARWENTEFANYRLRVWDITFRPECIQRFFEFVVQLARSIAPFARNLIQAITNSARAILGIAVSPGAVVAGVAGITAVFVHNALYDLLITAPEKGQEIGAYVDARKGYARFFELQLLGGQAPEVTSEEMRFGWEAAQEGWEQLTANQRSAIAAAAAPYIRNRPGFRDAIQSFLGDPYGSQALRHPIELLQGSSIAAPR